MSYWLVLSDVARVKGYILATRGLAQMRGASRLLVDAGGEVGLAGLLSASDNGLVEGSHVLRGGRAERTGLKLEDAQAEWELVFAAGGLGHVLFKREDDAQLFRERLAGRFREVTGSARAASAVVPVDDLQDGYGEAVARAAAELAALKAGEAGPERPAPIFVGGFAVPCSECGAEPATWRGAMRGAEREVCGTCRRKEERGAKLRRGEFLPAEEVALDLLKGDERLAAELRERLSPARKLDDLASVSAPEGYLAYLEADGDGVGRQLPKLRSREEYRAFAEALDAAARRSWAEAVQEAVAADGLASSTLPAALLVEGGDDLFGLCSPRLALPLVNHLCTVFPQTFGEEIGSRWTGARPFPVDPNEITMSAGVLFAHRTFPFSEFQRLGKELQGNAKALSRQRAGEAGWRGAIDFQFTTASALPSVKEYRERNMILSDERRTHRRPYPVGPDGLGASLGWARELGEGPRGSLRALLELLPLEWRASDRAWAIALSRMPDRRPVLTAVLEAAGGSVESPWTPAGDTPVVDLVEMAEVLR